VSTLGAARVAAARRLAAAGIADAARDARHLVAHAAGLPSDRLGLHASDPLTAPAAARLDAALALRAARVPVAQITGRRLFWGRAFAVTADVLDPRPETETLVAAALEAPVARLLDLGTGSGCLAVTLLAEWPDARGVGTDLSAPALAVAARNAACHGVAGRLELRTGDWFDALADHAPFDLIVSNPPYIPVADLAGLAPEVRDHEPHLALSDGGDGLGAYRRIAAGAERWLAPGGRLAVEVGPGQAATVAGMLARAGLGEIATRVDMDGRARVVSGTRPARLPLRG